MMDLVADLPTGTSEPDMCPTPTHTELTEPTVATSQHIEYHPRPNKTFMIRSREEPHKVIAVVNGGLEVINKPRVGGGWLWRCIKTDGFYGFRNTVSGKFIGHNGEGKFIAGVGHHKTHEFFMADRREPGGYVLLTKHDWVLKEMAKADDGKKLVEKKDGGITWEFVEFDAAAPYLESFST